MTNFQFIYLIILMISLSDEVEKFSKLLYNPQLKQFVSIDQKFVGGGISMQSIIEENSFIVQQMKKIHAYFTNYCKLNDKVYQKIIEHQLSVLNDKKKLNQIINSVDRNITSNVQIMKELSERIAMENKKSLELVSTQLQPLKNALNNRISHEEYQTKIRMSLKAYDDGLLFNKEQNQNKSQKEHIQVEQNNSKSLIPVIKKKGKVSYEDFYDIVSLIEAKMKDIEQKGSVVAAQSQQAKSMVLKYIPTIINHDNDLIKTMQELHFTKLKLQNQHNTTQQSISHLHRQLNDKTGQQVWTDRLNDFYQRKVNVVEVQMIRNRDEIWQQLLKMSRYNQLKLKMIVSDVDGCKNNIIGLDKALMASKHQIEQMKTHIKVNFDEFTAQDKRLREYIQSINHQIPKQIASFNKPLQAQVINLKNNFATLSLNIEDSILKTIEKKIGYRIKGIESQLGMSKQRLVGLKRQFEFLFEDSKATKQILSKKANYTDIIMNFDKKVDKQEMRSLELMIQDNSQKLSTIHFQQSTSLKRIQSPDSAKKSRVKASKTSMIGQRLSKMDKIDQGTSLFMCGFEGPLSVEKRSFGQRIVYSNQNWRKSMKSSGPMGNDFSI